MNVGCFSPIARYVAAERCQTCPLFCPHSSTGPDSTSCRKMACVSSSDFWISRTACSVVTLRSGHKAFNIGSSSGTRSLPVLVPSETARKYKPAQCLPYQFLNTNPDFPSYTSRHRRTHTLSIPTVGALDHTPRPGRCSQDAPALPRLRPILMPGISPSNGNMRASSETIRSIVNRY